MEKEKILVSACLLGECCRYDGQSKPCQRVKELQERFELVALCPECLGGLSTPRTPSERVGECVIMADGRDVTFEFYKGAEIACSIVAEQGITCAVLKARSPSCGRGEIYDGSFTKKLIGGNGVLADRLLDMGLEVFTEEELDKIQI